MCTTISSSQTQHEPGILSPAALLLLSPLSPLSESLAAQNSFLFISKSATYCILALNKCSGFETFQVLKILHGDQSEDLSFLQRQEARLSFDVDDMGCSLSDKGGEAADMQMHMALAMLGVDDDDVTSQSSTDPAHSDAFLEEYLEDRVDN